MVAGLLGALGAAGRMSESAAKAEAAATERTNADLDRRMALRAKKLQMQEREQDLEESRARTRLALEELERAAQARSDEEAARLILRKPIASGGGLDAPAAPSSEAPTAPAPGGSGFTMQPVSVSAPQTVYEPAGLPEVDPLNPEAPVAEAPGLGGAAAYRARTVDPAAPASPQPTAPAAASPQAAPGYQPPIDLAAEQPSDAALAGLKPRTLEIIEENKEQAFATIGQNAMKALAGGQPPELIEEWLNSMYVAYQDMKGRSILTSEDLVNFRRREQNFMTALNAARQEAAAPAATGTRGRTGPTMRQTAENYAYRIYSQGITSDDAAGELERMVEAGELDEFTRWEIQRELDDLWAKSQPGAPRTGRTGSAAAPGQAAPAASPQAYTQGGEGAEMEPQTAADRKVVADVNELIDGAIAAGGVSIGGAMRDAMDEVNMREERGIITPREAAVARWAIMARASSGANWTTSGERVEWGGRPAAE